MHDLYAGMNTKTIQTLTKLLSVYQLRHEKAKRLQQRCKKRLNYLQKKHDATQQNMSTIQKQLKQIQKDLKTSGSLSNWQTFSHYAGLQGKQLMQLKLKNLKLEQQMSTTKTMFAKLEARCSILANKCEIFLNKLNHAKSQVVISYVQAEEECVIDQWLQNQTYSQCL